MYVAVNVRSIVFKGETISKMGTPYATFSVGAEFDLARRQSTYQTSKGEACGSGVSVRGR